MGVSKICPLVPLEWVCIQWRMELLPPQYTSSNPPYVSPNIPPQYNPYYPPRYVPPFRNDHPWCYHWPRAPEMQCYNQYRWPATPVRNGNQYNQQFSRGPKIEFPKFDGELPKAWKRKVEKYFELAITPEDQKVSIAEVYLSGRANQWINGNEIDTDPLTWQQFCVMIRKKICCRDKVWCDWIFHRLKPRRNSGSLHWQVWGYDDIGQRNHSALKERYFSGLFYLRAKKLYKDSFEISGAKNPGGGLCSCKK